MPKPYRSRSRLVVDLLRAVRAEGDAQTTRLLLLANLSHLRLQDHLAQCLGKGWLEERTSPDGRKAWRLTPAGAATLVELERIEDAMNDFGLPL